jgi:hypothetical protein
MFCHAAEPTGNALAISVQGLTYYIYHKLSGWANYIDVVGDVTTGSEDLCQKSPIFFNFKRTRILWSIESSETNFIVGSWPFLQKARFPLNK